MKVTNYFLINCNSHLLHMVLGVFHALHRLYGVDVHYKLLQSTNRQIGGLVIKAAIKPYCMHRVVDLLVNTKITLYIQYFKPVLTGGHNSLKNPHAGTSGGGLLNDDHDTGPVM
jgi:hypothetical protein